MPNGPKKLADRPESGDDQVTDVLADLLDTVRLAALMYGRFELGAPWGLQCPDTDLAHLVVVGRGSVHLEVDGGAAPIALSAGDLALLPHGGAHALRDAPGSPLHALGQRECARVHTTEPMVLGGDGARTTLVIGAFRFGAAGRTLLFEQLPRVIHVAAHEPAVSPWLVSTVQLFIAESASRNPGASVIVSRLADVLLVQAIRSHISGTDCQERGLRALVNPQIGKALSLIHERPADPWTVESLASAVALSRSGFAARFTALVGEPPLEYLARWRMTKAAQLLRESELSMDEVAQRVGYQSKPSFNRAFKRWQGIAPGAFRRDRLSTPPTASTGT
jgi:AraC-like DNA-binding protein